MGQWTKWLEIGDAQARNGSLKGFGLYQIRAVSPQGKPIRIFRLKDADPGGILYVGRSGFQATSPRRTVANRIGEFVGQRHSGGITYAKAAARLKSNPRFAGHRLQVRARFLPDSAIVQEEARVLEAYFKKYTELPPCNSSSGSRGP